MLRKILIFVLVITILAAIYWFVSPFLSKSVVYENQKTFAVPLQESSIDLPAIESKIKSEAAQTSVSSVKSNVIPASNPAPAPIAADEDILSIEQSLDSFNFDNLDSGL